MSEMDIMTVTKEQILETVRRQYRAIRGTNRFVLGVSQTKDFAQPQLLEGSTLSGEVYIRLEGDDIKRVVFFRSWDTKSIVERFAPYDFNGSKPLDLSSLPNGEHFVSAWVDHEEDIPDAGIVARFFVENELEAIDLNDASFKVNPEFKPSDLGGKKDEYAAFNRVLERSERGDMPSAVNPHKTNNAYNLARSACALVQTVARPLLFYGDETKIEFIDRLVLDARKSAVNQWGENPFVDPSKTFGYRGWLQGFSSGGGADKFVNTMHPQENLKNGVGTALLLAIAGKVYRDNAELACKPFKRLDGETDPKLVANGGDVTPYYWGRPKNYKAKPLGSKTETSYAGRLEWVLWQNQHNHELMYKARHGDITVNGTEPFYSEGHVMFSFMTYCILMYDITGEQWYMDWYEECLKRVKQNYYLTEDNTLITVWMPSNPKYHQAYRFHYVAKVWSHLAFMYDLGAPGIDDELMAQMAKAFEYVYINDERLHASIVGDKSRTGVSLIGNKTKTIPPASGRNITDIRHLILPHPEMARWNKKLAAYSERVRQNFKDPDDKRNAKGADGVFLAAAAVFA